MSCLAIHCNASGRIIDVLCDEHGLFGAPISAHQPGDEQARADLRGRMLSGYVAPGGAQHFTHLLSLVEDKGAVGEWSLDLQGDGEAVSFRLWAASLRDPQQGPPQNGDVLDVLILGTSDADAGVEQIIAAMPVPAQGGQGDRAGVLDGLVQRIRAHASDPATLLRDLRAQVGGLKQQVQPPPMIEHRLLGMAAHDLRNPLLVLSMGCSYLLHDAKDLNDEQRTMLSESLDTCEFMNRLVEGMIELAHVAMGSVALNRETTDLAEMVALLVQRHGRVAHERGIAMELTRAVPVTADVDAVRIGQVVNQLLSNTVMHCPEGTTVRVWLDRAGDHAVVGVEDDGPGIAPEIREMLFRPLGKPHTSTDPKRYGAGMGLAIARYIVEGHDGCIEVTTEVGQGSRFEVKLPIA